MSRTGKRRERLIALVTETLAKTNEYGIQSPVWTIGECLRSYSCKQFDTDLGNGLCVECWDRRVR